MPQAPGGPPIDYFDNKKLTTPLRTVVQPESLEALNDDIQQERRVRQHRTESRKALTAFQRRGVCQFTGGGDYYYSV